MKCYIYNPENGNFSKDWFLKILIRGMRWHSTSANYSGFS